MEIRFFLTAYNLPLIAFLPAPAENAQKEQEHIDEIQIKHQRPEDRQLFRRSRHVLVDRFKPLRVVSRQTDKDRDAAIGNDPSKSRRVEEYVRDARDDHAPKGHSAKTSDGGQVLLRHPAVHAHARKRHGRDKKS